MSLVTDTPFGEDLLSLHAAATLVRTGRAGLLYDDPTGVATQAALLGRGGGVVYNRYIAPPHTAALFAPFTHLPFGVVGWLWAALSLGALMAVPWLLGARRPLKTAAMSLAFVPVLEGLAAGQNALFTLFLFSLGFHLWRRGRDGAAGLVLGLMALYKPHLLVGVGVLF